MNATLRASEIEKTKKEKAIPSGDAEARRPFDAHASSRECSFFSFSSFLRAPFRSIHFAHNSLSDQVLRASASPRGMQLCLPLDKDVCARAVQRAFARKLYAEFAQ